MMRSSFHGRLLAGVAAVAMLATPPAIVPAAAQTAPYDNERGVYSFARDLKAVAPTVVKVIVLGHKQAEGDRTASRGGQGDDPYRGQSTSAQVGPQAQAVIDARAAAIWLARALGVAGELVREDVEASPSALATAIIDPGRGSGDAR